MEHRFVVQDDGINNTSYTSFGFRAGIFVYCGRIRRTLQ
jgi:hypothetical protein